MIDGNGEIDQHVRAAAAARLSADDPKTKAIREKILAGEADEHPLVQGAAFYRGRK